MKKVLMTLALSLCTLLQAAIQPTYTFKHINAREGMSNDFILDMAIDGQGFVWSATESGLNKWTGNGNIVYKENNSGLVSNELTSLYYDTSTNILWIGSKEVGISLFDCRTQQFQNMTTREGLSNNDISDIMPAGDQGIWIVYFSGNIDLYDKANGNITRYNRQNVAGLTGRNRCCRDDNNGLLYLGHAGSGMSIINLKDRTARQFRHDATNPKSIPGDNVRSIYIDHLKNVWVGTNGGLALFNPLTEEFTCFRHDSKDAHSLVGDNIHSITEMHDETLWIASDLGGISILDLHNFEKTDKEKLAFENITHTNSNLSSPNTRIILEDKFHNIWIGNYSTGIDFVSHKQSNFQIIPYFSEVNGEKLVNRVYGIKANEDGSLWLGGENELSLYKNHQIVRTWNLSTYMSRAYSVIYIIEKDREGNIWMGINDEGVIRYNPQTNTFKHIDLGMENLDIHAFYEDNNGSMWIGSENGIYVYEQGKVQKVEAQSWKHWNPIVYALNKDDQQKTWVGTLGAGIYVLDADNKELIHLDTGNKLSSKHINQIYKDRKGGLWIATYNGLNYIKDTNYPDRIEIYDERHGLADNHIRAILQDKQGNIWVSTYTGIACWNAFRQKFYNYNYNDGVALGGFVESSSAMMPDGTLCFGSPHGVCYFNPQLMKTDESVSPIEIISCESFNEQATGRLETVIPDSKGLIRLAYNQNTFRISFAVADYSQNGQVECAYMLDGSDKSWYNTEGDNAITFHNMASGEYTFKIKVRLKNGEWNEKDVASIHIVISPPIWATWYAKSLYILAILCIIYLIFRSYRKKLLLKSSLEVEKNSLEMEKRSRQKEQELNNERLRFYTNIAHELRTPLTLIIGPLEDLKDNKDIPAAFRTKIQTIYRSAVQLLNLINQLMEFRKTETQNRQLTVSKGNLSNLITEIGLGYKELNRNEHVRVNIEVELVQENIYFDADIITIILNNLLSNAIKYTPAGQITLSMHRIKVDGISYIEMIVADTGYGIDAESLPHIYDRYYQSKGKHQASGTGIGLALVKSLVDLHHGSLEVESAVEKGTTFRFRIQTDYNYPEALHKEEKVVTVAKETAEEVESESASPILLVVEDNADIREYIANELHDSYKILQANDGKEGLTLALRYTPNIIVSDIMMPEMDGIAMCKAIKENMNTSHIPVILLTAKDSIQDKEEGYDSGADSYLTKPFSAKLLRSRIKNLLETRKRLARQIVENVPPTVAENTGNRQSLSSPHPQLNRLDKAFLSKLTSLIEDNLDEEKIDTAFMTDRMNMSYSTFYRKVKALTELTPNEFVRKIKLKNSALLLQTGEYSIQEAAMRTGFNNMAHFRDCFKEEFGVLPSEYMRQYKN